MKDLNRIVFLEKIEQKTGRRSGTGGKTIKPRFRFHVVMEDGEEFTLSCRQAAGMTLAEGMEIPPEDYAKIMEAFRISCMQRCGNLLGTRDYSVQRLKKKLSEAGYPPRVIDDAIHKLKEAGYLDDSRYAQNYVRYHLQDRSRLRIMRDLAERGISDEDAEAAFEAVGEEEDTDSLQRQQIKRLLEKRGYHSDTATYQDRQKIMGFLHRKGYPADLIRQMTGSSNDFDVI